MSESEPAQVLYMEDDAGTIRLVQRRLGEAGYAVHVARDGEEGLAMVAENTYDVVMVDQTMPVYEGLEVIRILASREPLPPIVMVTGTGSEGIAVEAMKLGASDYIVKDVDGGYLDLLPVVIERVLRQRQLLVEKQQAEKELGKSEQRYQSFYAGAAEGILVADIETRALRHANPAICEMLGYCEEELKQMSVKDLHPRDSLAHVLSEFQAQARGEKTLAPDIAFLRKDGTMMYADVNTAVVSIDGRKCTVGFFTDITERKRAERLLEALNQAALAMAPALTPDEIFAAVGETLRGVGLSCILLPLDESQTMLLTRYVAYDSRAVRAAEKLTGLSQRHYAFPIESVDAYSDVVWKRKTVYISDMVAVMRQLVPGPIKMLARQLVRMLKMTKSIATPLVVEDEVIGVLSVHSDDLIEEDALAIAAFANQMAAAWRKAELYEQTRQEIAERKQVEEALRESEARFRQLFENMRSGVAIYQAKDRSQDFVFADFNRAGERIDNVKREDLIGQSVLEMFPGVKEFGLFNVLQRVWRTGESEHLPISMYEDERIAGWRENYVYRLPSGEVVAVYDDVTERKRAEEERERLLAQIREQVRQVQRIVDTVPEGVLLLDHTGRVILANPVAEGSLSVLAGAQVGDTLTHLGDRSLAELLATPLDGLRHEVVGDGRAFEIIARPVESDLEASDSVLVIREVTHEREVQRQAQQRDRLASVGRMSAGIAHDFNNMLTTIMLYAQILRRHRYLPSDMEPGLETILDETRRATDLVGQILDFSRSSPIETHPVDLGALVKENVHILEHTIREDIQLRLNVKTERCTVAADPTRLQQVMMNLVINARDAMPGGGELSFSLDRLVLKPGERPPVTEMAPGEWVCMAISDSGTGIAPDVLEHIFEPFFTTKAPGKGTGLGLAQVYGIVRQHDGHVGVETEEGRGTTFLVYLPAREEQTEKEDSHEAVPIAAGEGETVLLVEDEERLRNSAREVLESLGYRVLVAGDGVEALKVYGESGAVDLVITDLVMPRMGGEKLIRGLRRRDPALKALAVTGYVTQEDLPRLAEAGFVDVIRKPFDVDVLATAVRNALGNKNSLPKAHP